MVILTFCVILSVLYTFPAHITAEELTTTTTALPDTTLAPFLPTSAEKWVRFRRQPTVKVIKHFIRSPKRSKLRRRFKRPKIKYGPPSYSFAEPLSYYKPKLPPPKPKEQASFSFDEFKHLNFDASEFDFPPSSYEAQAMNLDFNGYGDSSFETPKKPSIEHSFESEPEEILSYNPESIPETPSNKYEASPEENLPRVPHQTYGVPEQPTYGGNFKHATPTNYETVKHPSLESETYDSGKYRVSGNDYSYSGSAISSHKPTSTYDSNKESLQPYKEVASIPNKYEVPSPPSIQQSNSPPVAKYEHTSSGQGNFKGYIKRPVSSYDSSFDSQPPYQAPAPPATKYGPPSVPAQQPYSPPIASYEHKPSSQEDYQMYDKKLTNSGFQHSYYGFGEPPAPKSNIEITYSPSYEINIPPTKQKNPDKGYSEHVGNFAEPPVYLPPEYSQPEFPAAYPPATHPPAVHPPAAHPPTAHLPAAHPPAAHPPAAHPPAQELPPYYHAPAHPAPETSTSQVYPQDDYSPPSPELPLNPHHQPPAYDFPKSSYEVPLYDPIPFDSLNNEQREYYPPHTQELPIENNNYIQTHEATESRQENKYIPQHEAGEQSPEISDMNEKASDSDTHSSSKFLTTTNDNAVKPKRVRKRKRVRGSSTIKPIKHILDVPELKEAFEAGMRKKHKPNTDAETNESSKVEEAQYYDTSTIKSNEINENYLSDAWNPMRIRTSTRLLPPVQPPKTITTIEPSKTQSAPIRTRNQHRFKQQNSNAVTSTSTQKPNTSGIFDDIAILSIEKSRSHSYYDGTVPPPSTKSWTRTHKTASTRFRMPTKIAAQSRMETVSKLTTKSVFDTTHFKSPRNDKEANKPKYLLLEQNLPKNHKLF